MPGPFSFFDNEDDDTSAGGLVAKPVAGDNSAPFTITEVSQLLKRTVEDRFGHVKLRGELSGVKRAASGHLYCCLKDEGAVIDGVLWRTGAQRLSFVPEDGVEVIAWGKLTTYPGRSKYQIVIEGMEIAGEGALLALLEKTRRRLEAEGLFAAERKRPLPFLPAVIGVVTSPTGAVIRDILHRLADRFPSRVLVWPVMVQGQGAAEQIAAAIRGFSEIDASGCIVDASAGSAVANAKRRAAIRSKPDANGPIPCPDLVIVARGGGSIEDLWAFNDELVVRAIAASTIPTISAVGHETDTTLADFAADRRAPTPTAAAEMAVPIRRDLAATLDELSLRKRRCALRPVELGRERLEQRVARLPRPEALAAQAQQRLDDLCERLRRGLSDQTTQARERLQADSARLSIPLLRQRALASRRDLAAIRLRPALLEREVADRRTRLEALDRLRRQLDPKAPLARGYALVCAPGHPVITSRDLAARQDRMTLEFADGTIEVSPRSAPEPARKGLAKGGKPPRYDQPKLL